MLLPSQSHSLDGCTALINDCMPACSDPMRCDSPLCMTMPLPSLSRPSRIVCLLEVMRVSTRDCVPACSHPCAVCNLVPLYLPLAEARVQPCTSLHLMDSHHAMGCAAQYHPYHAAYVSQPVWLVGLHHTGDVHLPVPHLVGYWHPQWPAQDAVDFLPTELPAAELCCINSWYALCFW